MQSSGLTQWRAQRLSRLPAYLFVEIDRKKREAIEQGRDVIDFGVGDPDRPTPNFIIDRLSEAIRDPGNHRYGSSLGSPELRQAIATYFARRFDVELDPGVSDPARAEVAVLLGAKEGIGHLPLAVLNPGEIALVPEPGYPVYVSGTVFAGGECHTMALRESNGWLPALGEIPAGVLKKARLLWLNYPNNPTAAVAPLSFFEEAVAFARKHDLLIAQDAAYTELFFDAPPPSILQVAGAKDVAIEFHSLSKTFNMTGWRVAFVAGNPEVLAALVAVKSNLDSGVFPAVQQAAVTAMSQFDGPDVKAQVDRYRRRRDLLVSGLKSAGWSVSAPGATIYVWAKCPGELDSLSLASRLLDQADVVVIPGVGFGAAGEGYVRFALTVSEERTRQAVQRLAKVHG